MARQFVDEVDGKRLSYIAQCFSALGFDIAESRKRAFALYSYELAESLLSNQGTGKTKGRAAPFHGTDAAERRQRRLRCNGYRTTSLEGQKTLCPEKLDLALLTCPLQ